MVECVECGVPTTTQKPPDVTILGEEGEENLAYDFHEWTGQSRGQLEALLVGEQIIHVWQGATLMVPVATEERVDVLINEVDLASRPRLDVAEEKVEYSLADFTDAQVSLLIDALESNESEPLPFEIGELGDLMIHAKDEERVEAIFDRLSSGGSVSGGTETQNVATQDSTDSTGVPAGDYVFGDITDADIPYILSELFRLCGKIEADAILTSTDLTEGKNALQIIPSLDLPFGFTGPDWQRIVDYAGEMLQEFGEFIEASEQTESPEFSPTLKAMAAKLREALPILQ